jgi:hypothetical protein
MRHWGTGLHMSSQRTHRGLQAVSHGEADGDVVALAGWVCMGGWQAWVVHPQLVARCHQSALLVASSNEKIKQQKTFFFASSHSLKLFNPRK